MSRFGQQLPYRQKCERLTEQQKYLKLQNIGGLNQQYMANTPVEASRNFPRLLPTYDDPPTSLFSDGAMFSDVSDADVSLICVKYYASLMSSALLTRRCVTSNVR